MFYVISDPFNTIMYRVLRKGDFHHRWHDTCCLPSLAFHKSRHNIGNEETRKAHNAKSSVFLLYHYVHTFQK